MVGAAAARGAEAEGGSVAAGSVAPTSAGWVAGFASDLALAIGLRSEATAIELWMPSGALSSCWSDSRSTSMG